jgi:hypothetical protein
VSVMKSDDVSCSAVGNLLLGEWDASCCAITVSKK